jgi:hypothetical protein
LKIKLQGCHFEATEVIETESQVMPKHPHRTCSRPKVSFWPDGGTSPRNCGWRFVCWTYTYNNRFKDFFYVARLCMINWLQGWSLTTKV